MAKVDIGDWLLLTEEISEDDFLGEEHFLHGRRGELAHVMALQDGGFVTAFFERTLTECDIHESEFLRLCNGRGTDLPVSVRPDSSGAQNG